MLRDKGTVKNILINYTGRRAGGPPHAYEMCKGLLKNKMNVVAVISRQVDNFSDWEKLPLKKLITLDTYTNKKEFFFHTLAFSLWGRQHLKKELNGIPIDAIYVPMGTYWSYLISEVLPHVPVYYTIHDPILHSGEKLFNHCFSFFSRHEIQKARKVIILSKKFVPVIEKIYKRQESDIIVLPQGAFWEYKRQAHLHTEEKRLVSYLPDKINFLFFGRIERYKGLKILLEAYQQLEKDMPEKVSLTIIGNGDFSPYRSLFQQLRSAVLLNRMIPDHEIWKVFDGPNIVTVLPYIDATQSGVIHTAMMFHSFVIASDAGALSEQLGDGKFGFVVKAGDVESLKNRMQNVVLYYEQYRKIETEAFAHIKSLSWSTLAMRLVKEMES